MRSVNLRDARKKLSAILDAAERGQSIAITRRGKKVAQIVPADAGKRSLPDLTEFRQSIRCAGTALSKTVVQSRREARF